MASAAAVLKSPWMLVVAGAFATGGWVVRAETHDAGLDSKLEAKADTAAVANMRRELNVRLDRLQASVDAIDHRQVQFFCRNREAFCR